VKTFKYVGAVAAALSSTEVALACAFPRSAKQGYQIQKMGISTLCANRLSSARYDTKAEGVALPAPRKSVGSIWPRACQKHFDLRMVV
jgi:hypothetical protein